MASMVEGESDILLGNKQILLVFAAVVILLTVAFTGGYMLGKGSVEKKSTVAEGQTPGESGTALVPQVLTPDETASTKTDKPAAKEEPPMPETKPLKPAVTTAVKRSVIQDAKPLLGLEKTPKTGQTFVQVAALTRTEAAATADVLRKQNFRAQIAPKPGSTSIFRVLVGPTSDLSEITATRDALRKIGFRDVIVQRY